MDNIKLNHKKISVAILCILLIGTPLAAQKKDSLRHESVYKVHHKIEIGISVVGLLTLPRLYSISDKNASLNESDVLKLNQGDVNAFDRKVFKYSETGYEKAQKISDNLMTGTILATALLFLDKDIRRDWLDILGMFGEAHLAGTMLHQISVFSVRRPRPLTYNTNLPMDMRTGGNMSNSFYSGHTSSTAISTFFMAKVYSDYHNLNTWQKAGIYTLATIPPAAMGHYRIKAGKHFRTDVIMGLIMGAATGILVPEFHKRDVQKFTLLPVYNDGIMGASFALKL
ncbi:phosphatase PAP2 family protein [Saccharicrinis aurantiacus]|uniref:phosphatase PAP2 family protein n=1 Tax=Saccharicrinis aurantiacus TaxID=1849719 RepID=UPI002490E045|nr:phosphatase PAP2 family protein [Saccharicrinis aurantiacus]